ncbi:MAG TPA: PAS domain S-box protein [Rhodospirillaceae bacterium]|nr:PAS domain S-box protein [Rhodospirillaceae bacterium]
MQVGGSSEGSRLYRRLAWAAGFVALYVLFDWLSYIRPYSNLDITPWNPPPGIALAFLLVRGIRWTPLVLFAALISDGVTRHFAAPMGWTMLADLMPVLGYSIAAWLLLHVLSFNHRLSSLRDVMLLLGMTVAASLLVACGFIGVYYLAGIIPAEDVWGTWMRYWIGDMIGVSIFAPLCLTVGQRPLPPLRAPVGWWTNLAQALSILLALWIVFGGDLAQNPTLYYPLFLPLIWVGAWHGLQGVAIALFATQVGMVVAVEQARLDAEKVTEVQFFLLALTLCCLFLGAIVTERRQVRLALRDSQARLKAIVDVAPEGMLTLDAEGHIETANPAFLRLSGRTVDDLLGRRAVDLFPTIAGLLDGNGGEGWLARPDGVNLPVEVSLGETELSSGRLRVVAVHDMSRHPPPG